MKKTSYYLIFLIIVGGVFISFWSYQKYFKSSELKLLLFKVEKGSIQEAVEVRGEVVSEKDFDLEFPFFGTVEKIFVKEGQDVGQDSPLMALETTDFKLEVTGLRAQMVQAEASMESQKAKLDELKRGTRPEEIQIQEVKVASTKIALEDAKTSLADELQDAHTKSDDAVRNKVDQFFSNPRYSNLQIIFLVLDSQLETDVEWQRLLVENTLTKWRSSLDNLTISSDFAVYIFEAKQNLNQIKSLMDKAGLAVNGAIPNISISQTTINGWKSDVFTGRTNVNTAINSITAAEEKFKTAQSNLALAEQELALKKAGTTPEQITAQEAQVKQAEANIRNYQAQIAIVQEKIKKSILYAPGQGKITKIWFEKKELFRPGQIAVSLSSSGHKIQADISELEIGKVREVDGNAVSIRLDAFPDLKLNGKVVSIEPREIIKEGDKYYRVNIFVEPHDPEVRSGMNADLIIRTSFKDSALKIPELVIRQKDNKKFVTIFEVGQQKEIEIETGISDGESIEVTKGLIEGQVVAVSAD